MLYNHVTPLIVKDEEKRHKEHVERVMARLRQEKDNWFHNHERNPG